MTQRALPGTKVRFLCLARNCEATIPRFLEYLGYLKQAGIVPSVIVGENGSKDRTRDVLDNAAGKSFRVLDTNFMEKIPSRLLRMAVGRQTLLESARAEGGSEDFVCVADLDDVMLLPPGPAAVSAALAHLSPDSPYFAVGATSEPFYYDLLSLRCDNHDYSTLHSEITAAKGKPLSYYRFHKRRIYANQVRATTREMLVCQSSFNGFCLYKAPLYYLGSYRSPDEALLCEHVTFNLSLARLTKQNMIVLPSLKVRMPANHGPVGLWRFWADRFRKLT